MKELQPYLTLSKSTRAQIQRTPELDMFQILGNPVRSDLFSLLILKNPLNGYLHRCPCRPWPAVRMVVMPEKASRPKEHASSNRHEGVFRNGA